MQKLITITLIVAMAGGFCFAQEEKTLRTIVVADEQPARRRINLIDYDSHFAWATQDFGDYRDWGGNTVPGLFVHSHAHDGWLRIVQVSTAGARFGKSPANVGIAAGWDFTSLASEKFVELPLSGGSIHLPEKVVYESKRNVYVLYFDVDDRFESMRTTLIISKKDLVEAFDSFWGKHK